MTNPVIIWYQPLEVYQFPKLPKCDQTSTPYQIVENRTKDNFLKITLDSLLVKHFSSYLTHKLQNRSPVRALRRASQIYEKKRKRKKIVLANISGSNSRYEAIYLHPQACFIQSKLLQKHYMKHFQDISFLHFLNKYFQGVIICSIQYNQTDIFHWHKYFYSLLIYLYIYIFFRSQHNLSITCSTIRNKILNNAHKISPSPSPFKFNSPIVQPYNCIKS